MDISAPITSLLGVGVKVSANLNKLGIFTISDLLYYPPFRYIDASTPNQIKSFRIGDNAVIRATIIGVKENTSSFKRMKMIEAEVEDESGTLSVIWFNQVYIKNYLEIGEQKIFAGKVAYDFKNKRLTLTNPLILNNCQILPVYHETKGIHSAFLRRLIKQLISSGIKLGDPLPNSIISRFNLVASQAALEMIHQPKDLTEISQARRRLGLEELIFLGLQIRLSSKLNDSPSNRIQIPVNEIKRFVDRLPFELTDSQRKSAWAILKDMDSEKPMQRLLMGDVGSGKTVVGAIASLSVMFSKRQALWLAPTEVLANQHFKTLSNLFEGTKFRVGLYTGANKHSDLQEDDLVVGTHALLEPSCHFRDIGLIVVDEQHRFGVKQRAKLTDLIANSPHFLSMTATPIPRTLALTIYGNLSISMLDQLPSDRLEIITKVVGGLDREAMYQRVRDEIKLGRQAFVITPLIQDSELIVSDKKTVIAEGERLQTSVFPGFKVGILHGKMKSKDKDSIMTDFKNKKIDILVSTSVIEVGIDIPNATVMIIEDADNFGLAQLHQFRGRVGRDKYQSYCFLVANSQNQKSSQRLNALVEFNSGFQLAEIDLELRGPGSLAGLKQSGLPDLRWATLTDTLTIRDSQIATELIINEGVDQKLEKEIVIRAETDHFE